jgi:hypothetical protein
MPPTGRAAMMPDDPAVAPAGLAAAEQAEEAAPATVYREKTSEQPAANAIAALIAKQGRNAGD